MFRVYIPTERLSACEQCRTETCANGQTGVWDKREDLETLQLCCYQTFCDKKDTKLCLGDAGAAEEAAVVPEESARHDGTAGEGVPDLLLRENTTNTRRQETAQHVPTHTHSHTNRHYFSIHKIK